MSFTPEQISNGQTVLSVVRSLGLSAQDTAAASLDAIMAGLDESGLKNDNYGDTMPNGQMSSSRGVFQQISAWGPLAQRENVAASTRMFLTGGQEGQPGLLDIKGWQNMQPWTAVQSVQQSEFADGSNYQQQMPLARQFIAQYGNGTPAAADVTGAATATDASTGTSSSGTASEPWYVALLDPFGVGKDVIGATGGMGNAIKDFFLEGVIILAGAGLVILGVWRMSAPARNGAARIAVAAAK